MSRRWRGGRAWAFPVILTLAAALSACGAGGAAPGGSASATVKVADNATLGKILVNAKGMTLYRFSKDPIGKSVCSGTCAGLWPALTVKGTPVAGSGVTGKLGTIQGSGGAKQVTCDGHPLYVYALDKSPGQTAGQGYLGLWNAVTPACGRVTKGIASSASTAGSKASKSSTAAVTSKAAATSTGTKTASGSAWA